MKKKTSGARAGAKKRNGKNAVFSVKSPANDGLLGYAVEEGPGESEAPEVQEVAPAAWMTPALMEETQAGWSKYYGRPLDRSEVLEILHNIRWFGELMLRGMNGGMK